MELVEREAELSTLSELLETARSGAGALAMLEAPAGQGKTALLRAARDRAKQLGMRVVSATGSPLERDFPFGVVRQLFEADFRSSSTERLDQLLAGAASLASGVFDAAPDADMANDVSHAQLNGLFWFTVNLSEEQPLLVVVDDAHWADAPSLRFLTVLARRLEDLPVAVAVGSRPAEPDAEQDLLDALALAPETRAIRPGVLSHDAVQAILTEWLGREVDAPFAAACAELQCTVRTRARADPSSGGVSRRRAGDRRGPCDGSALGEPERRRPTEASDAAGVVVRSRGVGARRPR
jgi:hypothetical protein